LNHPDQLTRLTLMHQTPRFLADAFAALPEELRARLSSIYADGIITVHFCGAVNIGERRRPSPSFATRWHPNPRDSSARLTCGTLAARRRLS
jgi:hypothetical protein